MVVKSFMFATGLESFKVKLIAEKFGVIEKVENWKIEVDY